MFESLKNSWELTKASAAVLRADKELVLFPLFSTVAVTLVTASFVLPIFLTDATDKLASGPLGYVVLFLFYLAQYFVIFFCNSALVGAALIRLRGGDPTLGDGFRIALGRIGPIFGYALLAATVGMALRTLQERAGFLGKIVISLLGAAWSVASFLVVPILVSEGLGPIDAVKRSVELLKKTWGETLIGSAGIGTVFSWISLAAVFGALPLIAVAFIAEANVVGVVLIGGLVTLLGVLALISAALTGIYTAAVFRYAAEGEIGLTFSPAMVRGAFKSK